ncbi:unnamed protein product [Pleuronectes platessa]|uniref:Uncharacterized protein n=1 Tax=Pleuronectes platessa TaxID=8262 RepID=A0A9N7UTM5_PLEPL|nr:unnamed protein product [Pleuronectes platessa]
MMEVVLTRLRDFSCKTSTFNGGEGAGQSACRETRTRMEPLRDTAGGEGSKMDIESALGWLRRELMEMRSQDQALIRQLMELHSGIQELKQELSEEEERRRRQTKTKRRAATGALRANKEAAVAPAASTPAQGRWAPPPPS